MGDKQGRFIKGQHASPTTEFKPINPWTEGDLLILEENWNSKRLDEIQQLLRDKHTIGDIDHKGRRIGLGERPRLKRKAMSLEGRRSRAEATLKRWHNPNYREQMRLKHIGKKHTAEWRAEASQGQRGKRNSFYGRKHSPETKAIISQKGKGRPSWRLGVPYTEEEKGRLSLKMRMEPLAYPILKELYYEQKLSMNKIAKKFNISGNTVRKWFRLYGMELERRLPYLRARPTKPEQRFIELSRKYNLPFRYTGNGSFWVENTNINPDFVECNGHKVCIEIFGDYWHTPLFNHHIKFDRTEKGRKGILKKYGWKCIVLWQSALMADNGEQYALKLLEKEGVKCHILGS